MLEAGKRREKRIGSQRRENYLVQDGDVLFSNSDVETGGK